MLNQSCKKRRTINNKVQDELNVLKFEVKD